MGVAPIANGIDRDEDPPLLVLDESPDDEEDFDEPEDVDDDFDPLLESLLLAFDEALDDAGSAGLLPCRRLSAVGVLDDESPPLIIALIFVPSLVLLSLFASGFCCSSTAAWSP